MTVNKRAIDNLIFWMSVYLWFLSAFFLVHFVETGQLASVVVAVFCWFMGSWMAEWGGSP